MVQLLLRAVSRIRKKNNFAFGDDDTDDDEIKNLSKVVKHDLIFDVNLFKRPKEKGLPDETKIILRLPSSERTDDLVRIAVTGLIQAVPEYADFPSKIQKSFAKVCNLDKFEAGRVIIRQGHKADNFYLIVSGITAVIKTERNRKTGEHVSNTVAYLNKGKTFGELAIMHQSARNATVRCESDVMVLTIDRDNFIDLFMHIEKGKEPEHISYLREIDIFNDWPIDKLPYDNPRICLLTYFRKGLVMCKDSNSSDWVYIVKNGTCRIMKTLKVPKKAPYKPTQGFAYVKNMAPVAMKANSDLWKEVDILPMLFNNNESNANSLLQSSPSKSGKSKKVLFDDYKNTTNIRASTTKSIQDQHIFIEVQQLKPKDVFGLINIVFDSVGQSTNVSLVSEGSECILIDKTFFINNMSENFREILGKTIKPFPSDQQLQTKLQVLSDWHSYKIHVFKEYFNSRRKQRDKKY